MQLRKPTLALLPRYVAALERGWTPDETRGKVVIAEHLELVAKDAAAFLQRFDNPQGGGPPVTLADGSHAERLPSCDRWLWDDDFAGRISLRWRTGTHELPPHCLGHIGYNVVPWRQKRGYATQALRDILPEAKTVGLTYVEITCEEANIASQKVITANGGQLVEHFTRPDAHGNRPCLRFRIALL